jgi:hypothetical protein
MTCCGAPMRQLAGAQRAVHGGGFHRVAVYRCDACGRIDSLGQSCDPGWVSAKARMFCDLRTEAFQRAGLLADPAIAVFDAARRQVRFGRKSAR